MISAIILAVLTLLSSPVWGPPICEAVGICGRKTDDTSLNTTTTTTSGPSTPGRSASPSPSPSKSPAELPWPSPEDCLKHNPNALTYSYNSAQQVWQVLEGGHSLLAYKREADAKDGLAMAKRFRQHCFVGRDNKRPERYRYVMDYWREPSGIATTIAAPDCIRFNPGNLSIVDLGATGWQIRDGSSYIAVLDTRKDAESMVLVMKHYTNICYLGRGYSGSDRLRYITTYFS
ncbi:MAG TPA: hypothetical protein VFC19_03840 [Candidatus Limnocylindrales bacterium]|nr:hypothetical protein [Candidatus Limnocylindrales bacterium]